MTGQLLALALIVVFLVGGIAGILLTWGIEWQVRRKAAERHDAWMRQRR